MTRKNKRFYASLPTPGPNDIISSGFSTVYYFAAGIQQQENAGGVPALERLLKIIQEAVLP